MVKDIAGITEQIKAEYEFKNLEDNLKNNIIKNAILNSYDLLEEIQSIYSLGIKRETAKPDDLRLIGDQSVKETFKQLYLLDNKDENIEFLYNSAQRLIKEVEGNYPDAVINDEIRIMSESVLEYTGYIKGISKVADVDYDEDRC